jgi:NAD(P)-dependent dehydrogenase (short-subunit alcohol dehydrogenase family)
MTGEKVALVTGASSGIGRATAALLAGQGFRVFGTMRNPNGKNGRLRNVEVLPLDVRDEESVRSCLQTVLRLAGRVDALVNNAGYTLIGSSEETSVEEAKELFDTNFFGVLRMSRAVLPVMREQGTGRIANIGSVVGFLPAPYQGIYAASKHALEGYSESLDHEVRQFGIRVSVIEPGFTRTDTAANGQLVSQPLATYASERDHVVAAVRESIAKGEEPSRVALVVLEALTVPSPRHRYLAGRNAKFVSRLRKFAPPSIFDKGLRKQFKLATAQRRAKPNSDSR